VTPTVSLDIFVTTIPVTTIPLPEKKNINNLLLNTKQWLIVTIVIILIIILIEFSQEEMQHVVK